MSYYDIELSLDHQHPSTRIQARESILKLLQTYLKGTSGWHFSFTTRSVRKTLTIQGTPFSHRVIQYAIHDLSQLFPFRTTKKGKSTKRYWYDKRTLADCELLDFWA